jgi:putative phosphoribosyl transferase
LAELSKFEMATIIYPDGDESDSSTHQIPLHASLRSAGCQLALELERYRRKPNLIVLGIALGGMPVAHEVARHLGAPLDLIIIRRLASPAGAGSQVCAVSVAGHLVLDDELLPLPETPSAPFEYFVADALAQLEQREKICRRGRQAVDLADKTVLLVDCGAKTAMTMQAAIKALRARTPARIIAALPVASVGARELIAAAADELLCLASPRPFGHAGLWYSDFRRPEDEGVGELLDTDR